MNATEFARELPLWYRTGSQDASNILDVDEIIEDLETAVPSVAAIKRWLVGGQSPDDFEGALEFPEDATADQKQKLLSRWADGWSEFAHQRMKERFAKRVKERVFYEGERGMLGVGWYVSMDRSSNRGPFLTKEAALKEAEKVEESGDD